MRERPEQRQSRRRDVVGADLVRQARASNRSRYRPSLVAASSRFARVFGREVGGGALEFLFGLMSLGLFSGLVAVTVWGWSRSKLATAGAYLPIVVFLGYGAVELWRTVRRREAAVPRKRLTAAALAAVSMVALWLTCVAQFGPATG